MSISSQTNYVSKLILSPTSPIVLERSQSASSFTPFKDRANKKSSIVSPEASIISSSTTPELNTSSFFAVQSYLSRSPQNLMRNNMKKQNTLSAIRRLNADKVSTDSNTVHGYRGASGSVSSSYSTFLQELDSTEQPKKLQELQVTTLSKKASNSIKIPKKKMIISIDLQSPASPELHRLDSKELLSGSALSTPAMVKRPTEPKLSRDHHQEKPVIAVKIRRSKTPVLSKSTSSPVLSTKTRPSSAPSIRQTKSKPENQLIQAPSPITPEKKVFSPVTTPKKLMKLVYSPKSPKTPTLNTKKIEPKIDKEIMNIAIDQILKEEDTPDVQMLTVSTPRVLTPSPKVTRSRQQVPAIVFDKKKKDKENIVPPIQALNSARNDDLKAAEARSYPHLERFESYYPHMQKLLKRKVYKGDLDVWELRYQILQEKYRALPVGEVYISEIHDLQNRLKTLDEPDIIKEGIQLQKERSLPVTVQSLMHALGILLVKNRNNAKSMDYLQTTMLKNIKAKLLRFDPYNADRSQIQELQLMLGDWRFNTERMSKHSSFVGTLCLFVHVQYKILRHMLPKLEIQLQLCKFEVSVLDLYFKQCTFSVLTIIMTIEFSRCVSRISHQEWIQTCYTSF
jgi:hypothetical protein